MPLVANEGIEMQERKCQICGRSLPKEESRDTRECRPCQWKVHQQLKRGMKHWKKQLARSSLQVGSSLSAFSLVLLFTLVSFGVTAGVGAGYSYLGIHLSPGPTTIHGKPPTPFPVHAPVHASKVTEFSGGSFGGMASSPDGNLWSIVVGLGNAGSGTLVQVTPGGKSTVFHTPTANSFLGGITSGPDGNVWFTEFAGFGLAAKIGRVTLGGRVTEFPTPIANSSPRAITSGPDGNVWFTETEIVGNTQIAKIGRITPKGMITEFSLPAANSEVGGITSGPDGNVWFSEPAGSATPGKIGSITPKGMITEFLLPAAKGSLSSAGGITSGPDGNLWFTQVGGVGDTTTNIGRITPKGIITEFPGPGSMSYTITSGPDGNLWFTYGYHMIGYITPQGVFANFPIPPSQLLMDSNTALDTIIGNPDGNLWFTNFDFGKIGRISFIK
jgi:streptogramin lyase